MSVTFMLPAVAPAGSGGNLEIVAGAIGIVFLILSLGVHEAAHAWSAYKLGDSTAKDMGRMTLNPIVHIDLWWSIALPALCVMTGAPIFGGAKPVPVNFHRLRNPWVDMGLVAFAGPLSNFLLALVFLGLAKFFIATGYYNGAATEDYARIADLLPSVLIGAAATNVILFLFNLIPIPPLDGSRIVVNLLPESMRDTYLALQLFGLVAVYYLINYNSTFRSLYMHTYRATWHVVENIVSLGGTW